MLMTAKKITEAQFEQLHNDIKAIADATPQFHAVKLNGVMAGSAVVIHVKQNGDMEEFLSGSFEHCKQTAKALNNMSALDQLFSGWISR